MVPVPALEARISMVVQMFVLISLLLILLLLPAVFSLQTNGGFNAATGGGEIQTLWEVTNTIQYKPAPSLITRAEVRYDHSNSPVFMQGTQAVNNQTTLGFQVIYLF